MEFGHLADYGNILLTWIGFGTLIGLAASAVVPGRDPGGTVANMLMAIAGTLVGSAVLLYFYPNTTVMPMSLEGFTVGAGGAFVLLTFYRVMGGYWFEDGDRSSFRGRRRRRRIVPTIYDE